MHPYEVIFQNDNLLVVNKAPLVACHPIGERRGGTLIESVAEAFPEVLLAFGDDREGGLCHRIDNNTSGLVVIARDRDTRDIYRNGFQNGHIEKTYLAIVCGQIQSDIDVQTPIAHHQKNKKKMVVVDSRMRFRSQPRDARTLGRVVLGNENGSLLRLTIEGGRRHQIRVHLASIGFPLLGDLLYGKEPAKHMSGHALHAATLRLISGENLEAPCPKEWEHELIDLKLIQATE